MDFLTEKLQSSEHLQYIIKEISEKDLEIECSAARLKVFPTVDGSSQFQVMVFKPDMSILAAPRLCICDLCNQSYGSCSLFETYHLDMQNLKSTTLRSYKVSDEDHVVSEELVIPESLCVVAASENSFESVWFIRIESDEEVATHQIMDDYGHTINEGEKFI